MATTRPFPLTTQRTLERHVRRVSLSGRVREHGRSPSGCRRCAGAARTTPPHGRHAAGAGQRLSRRRRRGLPAGPWRRRRRHRRAQGPSTASAPGRDRKVLQAAFGDDAGQYATFDYAINVVNSGAAGGLTLVAVGGNVAWPNTHKARRLMGRMDAIADEEVRVDARMLANVATAVGLWAHAYRADGRGCYGKRATAGGSWVGGGGNYVAAARRRPVGRRRSAARMCGNFIVLAHAAAVALAARGVRGPVAGPGRGRRRQPGLAAGREPDGSRGGPPGRGAEEEGTLRAPADALDSRRPGRNGRRRPCFVAGIDVG